MYLFTAPPPTSRHKSTKQRWHLNTQPSCCRGECVHNRRGQFHPRYLGFPDALLRHLTRHADRARRIDRYIDMATIGEEIHLAQESLASGEGAWIEHLQEYVAAPARFQILTAIAGQALPLMALKIDSVS